MKKTVYLLHLLILLVLGRVGWTHDPAAPAAPNECVIARVQEQSMIRCRGWSVPLPLECFLTLQDAVRLAVQHMLQGHAIRPWFTYDTEEYTAVIAAEREKKAAHARIQAIAAQCAPEQKE